MSEFTDITDSFFLSGGSAISKQAIKYGRFIIVHARAMVSSSGVTVAYFNQSNYPSLSTIAGYGQNGSSTLASVVVNKNSTQYYINAYGSSSTAVEYEIKALLMDLS